MGTDFAAGGRICGGGAHRNFFVLFERVAGWPWMLLMGMAIWRHWAESSAWITGLFVGIDLILNGWLWVMLGLAELASVPSSNEAEAPFGE